MLIIPADKPLDWKRPPLLTLMLILLNVLVFFAYQGGDERRWQAAMRYYAQSGLAELEVPAYLDYLDAHGDAARAEAARRAGDPMALSLALNQDAAFLAELHAGRIISPDQEAHALWQDKRQRFDALYARISAYALGLTPAEFKPWHLLSHAFLHGDLGHLAGNMLFLFIFGAALEHALGKRRFLAAYLASAVAGGLLHSALNWGDAMPLVGASGAISGLMGAFTVWFGMRRIQFFYWLGFYFGYVRLPALIMLPFWLGKELLDAFGGNGGPVAYFAHVGGMLAGAGLAGYWRKAGAPEPEVLGQRAAPAREDPMRQALAHMENLRFGEAKQALYRLVEQQPAHTAALEKLYHLEKLEPASETYHGLCRRLWLMPHKRGEVDALILDLFRDYRDRAQPKPRLSAEAMQLLAARFLRMGEVGEVERLLAVLMQHLPDAEGTRQLRLELARVYLELGRRERGFELLLELEKALPETDQGRLASQLLNQQYREYR
ncbi:MAG: rhomboid family intramembrane serine protease [Gammaproteobacteria bacterium]|nr:rhomboid family intramembrane serine protease [Gammaproteobacteria bacterium]